MRWILFLVGFLSFGQGIPGIGGLGLVHAQAGASYSGPGDVKSGAKAWYGTRAYSATQAAALVAAIQICTASDAACTDIHVTSTGGLNASDITTSGCSAIDTCTVKILYDQSGLTNCSTFVCDVSQATIALRPTYKRSCTNSLPCLVFSAAASQILSNTHNYDFTTNQPFTVSYTAERTGNTSAINNVWAEAAAIQIGFSNSANQIFSYAGALATVSTISDSAYHAVQNIMNGASSVIYVDGGSNTVSAGSTGGSNTAINLGGGATTSNYFTGQLVEAGVWNGAFSGGDNSAMNSNQHAYWGF